MLDESVEGDWYLLGVHVGVVHHDIEHKRSMKERLQRASGISPFAEFIAIHRIAAWCETALSANAQVFNSATDRMGPTPIRSKRRRSTTAQSAGAAPGADEGGGEGEVELVHEMSEGWVGYYNRRLPPVPLPARPRTQSDPTLPHAAAARPAGGGTGGRDTRSL